MLFKGGQGKTPSKPPKTGATKPNMSAKGKRAQSDLKNAKRDEEKESAIDSEEYNDMVFDIEYGRSLMERADDFLENRPSVAISDTDSQRTKGGSKVSFLQQNKSEAFTKNPNNKLNRNKDRLDLAK